MSLWPSLPRRYNGCRMFFLKRIFKELQKMSAQLDKLQADVTAQTTVIQSATTLLASLSQAIKDAGTDPAALSAITDSLDSNTASLAAAVAANTPAAT